MTQIIKRNIPSAGYEQFDSVAIVDDAHQWSPIELGGNFIVETGLTLSDSDRSYLLMSDEGPQNFRAISQIPLFRGLLTRQQGLKQLHRRKYQNIGNNPALKSNAQERN